MDEKEQNNFWELTVEKLFGEIDKEDEKKLKKFLEKTENQKELDRLTEIHNKLPQTRQLRDVSRSRSWSMINDYFRKKKIRLILEVSKYAAVIILAFFIGTIVSIDSDKRGETAKVTEINVPLGQMSEIKLYDGTEVWLNSGTTLKYPKNFGDNNRDVILNGEAFFNVKHSDIPFKVQLKNSEVEVLGTSFNVVSFAEEQYSQVTLVKGSVKLNNTLSGKEITRMKPSQQIILSDDLKQIDLKTVNTEFYKSWTEGKIIFQDERLIDITKRLERWYNVDIRLSNPEIGDLRFSGTILKNKPFNQIAKAFEILLPVKVDYQNNIGRKDIVTISKKQMPMRN